MRRRAAQAEPSTNRSTGGSTFADRVDAGRQLATRLAEWQGRPVTVLGLPRGGVSVAAVVAASLDAPLDVVVVRKLGLPSQPELALGAVAEGGVRVLDARGTGGAYVSPVQLQAVELQGQAELSVLVTRLRRGKPPADLAGQVAVVVDDGLATGSTARAACLAARQRHADRIVLAVPVGPADTERRVPEADQVVCLIPVEHFTAVGWHYADFRPILEEEVADLLATAARRQQQNLRNQPPGRC